MTPPLLIGSVAPSGAERVAARLRALGVDLALSVPGSQVLPLWEALDRVGGIRLIVPRSERAAGLIAEGYGLASGRAAVVMNTLGPGVANEAVAVASARLSGSPVLYLTPSQPAGKRLRLDEVFQGLDHAGFMAGPAKEQFLCDSADGLESAIDGAHSAALTDPQGPVRLDVSFPILFRRSLRRGATVLSAPQTNPPLIAPGADLLLALDSRSHAGIGPVSAAGIDRDLAGAAIPGIDSPGLGVPFALGLRLGRPRTPVVLVLSAESLLAQLDGVIVATAAGIPVTIAAAGSSPQAEKAKSAAVATGAAWWPIEGADDVESVRAALLERTRGLTLLVVPEPAS